MLTQDGYDNKLQSGRHSDEVDVHAIVSGKLRQFLTGLKKLFGYANQLLQRLSAWLVSDNLRGEDAGCGGPRLVWLHVVCGCEAGWM